MFLFLMVLWNELDINQIDVVPTTKDKVKFSYKGGPLRFQIPRGTCSWGVNSYRSMQVELTDTEFIEWWRRLETHLCSKEPFSSNMRASSLRIKIDDSAYVFDKEAKQINPEVKEGLFRGQDVACLIEIVSTYFFNENWGLTIRIYQIKTLTDEEPSCEDEPMIAEISRGECAFLPAE